MKRRIFGAAVVYMFLALIFAVSCAKKPAEIGKTYEDNFERAELGADWYFHGGQWRIKDGRLYSPMANNSPLWLNRKLPRDVKIEVDVTPLTDDIDCKVEIFGDGKNHESGYIIIMGGWKNKLSIIARLDEHGKDRRTKRAGEHKANTTYRWTIIRKEDTITWHIDGEKYMTFKDPEPLYGEHHNRFAFSNWQTEVYFDNLRITPLE